MRQWLPHQDIYLDVILQKEAPPESMFCTGCQSPNGCVRCLECFGDGWECIRCCLDHHRRHPFHKVEKWDGKKFRRTTLASLGLVLFLGHGGDPCPGVQPTNVVSEWEDVEEQEVFGEENGEDEEAFPAEEEEEPPNIDSGSIDTTSLTVVHKGGIVSQPVRWCTCRGGRERHLQLLHLGLYPATQKRPKTAFTFDVLNLGNAVCAGRNLARSIEWFMVIICNCNYKVYMFYNVCSTPP